MQILKKPPFGLRHSRATVAFDGTAGNGAVGTVTVFTITGRVWVETFLAFCTEDLASAGGGTIQAGTTSDPDGFVPSTTATDIDNNEWWSSATPAPGAVSVPNNNTGGLTTLLRRKQMSESAILTIGTGDITNGTIIFDVWWMPITDNGALS